MTTRPIPQIQVVRAVAALIVVCFHAQGELNHRGFPDPFPDLTAGAFGVDLFFVVSGFIMVLASDKLFRRPSATVPFLARRVARVAPLYWLFTAAFAAIAVMLGHLPGHPKASLAHISASFLFLPAPRPDDGALFPVYALGWTLNYEMFFYACFAVALRLRRRAAVVAVSAGILGVVALGRVATLPLPFSYWADPISLEFVFGLWIASAHLAGWRVPWRAGLVLSAVAVGAVLFYAPHVDNLAAWRGLAWGLPAAAIVASALGADLRGGAARAVVRIGDASYSLYLVHSALFIAVFAGLARVMDVHLIPPAAYAILLVGGSVVAALALFRLFEVPVTRGLNKAIARRIAPRTSVLADLGPGLPSSGP